MKKLLLSLSCILVFNFLHAQSSSNLGFSQVLNFEYSTLCNAAYTFYSVDTLTVPSNKVWKITSGSAIISDWHEIAAIKVDNHLINSNKIYNSHSMNNCPVWLNSGNYTVYLGSTKSNQTIRGALSIIEFNIE